MSQGGENMRLIPSDPDVETIVGRIRKGVLDLQPNFQRGEVWSNVKKQKLIDSILREWHVPPIHIIKGVDGATDVVLDGQQRLTAIRDFLNNELTVIGNIEPLDQRITALDGLKYRELSPEWQAKVNSFPIRQFLIVDFKPSEPSELFYRLNQPVALTAAEQRNSFFGKPREQIKKLVEQMESSGLDKQFLGFSNARMSYDDVLARVCVTLESGLSKKVGAGLLADRYRSGDQFDPTAVERTSTAIALLGHIRKVLHHPARLNKASLFSWLIFFSRQNATSYAYKAEGWAHYFDYFEGLRSVYDLGLEGASPNEVFQAALFAIYNDRVKSRVADPSSVLLRDLVLWGIFVCQDGKLPQDFLGGVKQLYELMQSWRNGGTRPSERNLIEFAPTADWERVQ
jgi:hypothetical protein